MIWTIAKSYLMSGCNYFFSKSVLYIVIYHVLLFTIRLHVLHITVWILIANMIHQANMIWQWCAGKHWHSALMLRNMDVFAFAFLYFIGIGITLANKILIQLLPRLGCWYSVHLKVKQFGLASYNRWCISNMPVYCSAKTFIAMKRSQ